MSAGLPPKADIAQRGWYGRKVPEAADSDVCSENNAHIRIGNESYYLSADGKLMPSKKDQAPPDLSYFKQTGK